MGNITDLLTVIEEPLEEMCQDLEEALQLITYENQIGYNQVRSVQREIKGKHEKSYHLFNTFRQDPNNLFNRIVTNVCSAYEQFEDFYTMKGPRTKEEVKKNAERILQEYICLPTEEVDTIDEAMKLFVHEYKE